MNLKIYRKLFVLVVLSVGLFFAVSTNTVSAQVDDCCTVCQANYDYCVEHRCGYITQCVNFFCVPEYFSCADGCYPLICY